ncbi:MAG: hypothetical protein EZS28_038559 [Streblomastix strix]|uniref:Uncharacterized protein n=1 Tax=Streblomastix strix TaxID=222440 RepID=A0A5J4U6K2_9EUKA|nr:MAG: hypothetical protein EZS28_038559 [Streblomastix strix]
MDLEKDIDTGELLNAVYLLHITQQKDHKNISLLMKQVRDRDEVIARQREMYNKELLTLREQIFQKERLGEEYGPEDKDQFNPTEYLSELLGETQTQIETETVESLAKRTKNTLDKINRKNQDQIRKMEDRINVSQY